MVVAASIGGVVLKIGVALSGNGIEGSVGAGVLEALTEFGIRPCAICASGGGILAAYMYSRGADINCTVNLYNKMFVKDDFFANGLASRIRRSVLYEKRFGKMLKDSCGKEKIPLAICAENPLNGSTVIFSKCRSVNSGQFAAEKKVTSARILRCAMFGGTIEKVQIERLNMNDKRLIWPLIVMGAERIIYVKPNSAEKNDHIHNAVFTVSPVLNESEFGKRHSAEYFRKCGYDKMISDAAAWIEAVYF